MIVAYDMNTLNNLRMDTHKLINERFKGVNNLWRLLESSGVKVSVKTIEKWKERKSIPSNRLIQLHALSKIEGNKIELDDYYVAN